MIMVCVAGGTPEHVKADLSVVPLEIMQAGADLLQQAETFQGLLLVSASLACPAAVPGVPGAVNRKNFSYFNRYR